MENLLARRQETDEGYEKQILDYKMKLDEVKSSIQELVEKNHKFDIEFKNKDQTLINKERYIETLLSQAMQKDMELDKIHND